MRFVINPGIFQQHPDLKIGLIIIRNFQNNRRNSAVESLLRGIAAQRARELKDTDVHDHRMVQIWNQAYGKFGVNPHKFPPSIASLLKRVQTGKEIHHINLLVDLINYFSLKYLLPMGSEDIDWLAGDLKLTFTEGKEAFRPLGSINVEEAAEGEIAYMDRGGITCRYWNYRECERSKLTPKTVNAAIFVEDLSRIHMDRFGEILQDISETFAKYIGGRIEPYILNEENLSIDLGVEGRRTADDSKVTQQEKAYFLNLEKLKKKSLKPRKIALKKKTKSKKPKVDSQLSIDFALPFSGLELFDDSLLKQQLRKVVEHAVSKSFPKLPYTPIEIDYPSQSDHGDYASSTALKLAKELGLRPQEIAQKILPNIDSDLIEKVETAGPGFINFFIHQQYLDSELQKILKEKDKYGLSKIGKNKTVIVEYSSPNIAKPLGVHHLLSTVIGQSICNIFHQLGFTTKSINHIGDWGTQFGKLICAYKKWGSKESIEKDPVNEMLKLYVRFHDEAEKDPKLEDAARHEFKIFEEGDKENKKLWEWFVAESIKDINKTYDRLGGIHFDHTMGESFYEDKMSDLVEDGKKRGIFEKGDDGAYIVKYDDPNMAPLVIQKKDGSTLYSTRDFATLRYRINEWHPAKILYVVDIAQTLYFKQLFDAAKRFPWYHGEGEHVWFGRMRSADGQMSTRKGTIVLLNDLLEEAVTRSLKIIEEKNPDLKNKEEVAKTIGIGAVKYSILSQNRTTEIVFDWDKMLAFDGNSSPYLQYTYARAKSILRKSETPSTTSSAFPDPDDTLARIRAVIRLFPKFAEQIAFAAKEYKPNIISNYLYELAQAFNAFYNSVPVLSCTNAEERDFRLNLVRATSQVLKNGLGLLGIDVVEEM